MIKQSRTFDVSLSGQTPVTAYGSVTIKADSAEAAVNQVKDLLKKGKLNKVEWHVDYGDVQGVSDTRDIDLESIEIEAEDEDGEDYASALYKE